MALSYDVENSYGVLSESKAGWTKELKKISWNNREAKFDIRDWAPDGEKMGKGITLNKEELIKLREILNNMELD